MAKNMLIVESPAKATTINRYLGTDFEVLASYGHIRDLPSKDGAVDTDNDFEMHYELSEGSKKHVDAIVRAAKKADAVYLATDLDREGEAISWHLYEILREKGLTDRLQLYRVEFSEITQAAIKHAVDNPRDLSMDLIARKVTRAGQAISLTDQQIEDGAAYLASLGGDAKKDGPAAPSIPQTATCIACHGPTGLGNPAAGYPALAGQHAAYTAKQLRDYASGARKSDGKTQQMRDIASRLSQDEIAAVASYIQGLRQ